MKIRRGTPDDYHQVTERADLAFCAKNPVHVNFEQLRPDTIRRDEASMAQWLLAEVDGEIAAGIHIVPRSIQLTAGTCLNVSGLADVFTYPPFRGQGLMSALLKETIRALESEGCAMNVLGGDRLRYANYGWDLAGTDRQLFLEPSALRFDKEKLTSSDLRRCAPGDRTTIERMHAMYNRRLPRAQRTCEEFERTLLRSGVHFWINDTDEGFAYAAVRGNQIMEFAGDKAAIDRIFRFLVGLKPHTVFIPPPAFSEDIDNMLLRFAGHYSVFPGRMIRIIRLLETVKPYMPILEKRLTGWQGKRSLLIEDNNDSVTISKEGDNIELGPGPDSAGAADICVNRCDAARLLFGPFFPESESLQHDPFVRSVFPLPFHMSGLYKV